MQDHGRRSDDNPQAPDPQAPDPQAPDPQATDPQATDPTATTAGGLIAVDNRTGPGDLCNAIRAGAIRAGAIRAGATGTNDRDDWPV